jgi:hypothetical protein
MNWRRRRHNGEQKEKTLIGGKSFVFFLAVGSEPVRCLVFSSDTLIFYRNVLETPLL